jgi:endonuclease/exonuclease/phosphatase family metal-dependent hydrolase
MRIVSYNILDGGEGRADPLAEVIEAQRPDIVALIEADHPEVLARITKRLNMDHVVAQGEKHSVAILSRWPISESINHSARSDSDDRPRCLLEALIQDPSGHQWTIGAVHLHPRAAEADEQFREREIAGLLAIFEPHRLAHRHHLLVGDFNANSPIQNIDPERCHDSTREAWRQNGGHIPRTAIARLLAAGYTDTLHALHPDRAAAQGSFTTQHPGQRVDYIFTHSIPAARIKSAWIEHDRLAKYASDHYPVAAEL